MREQKHQKHHVCIVFFIKKEKILHILTYPLSLLPPARCRVMIVQLPISVFHYVVSFIKSNEEDMYASHPFAIRRQYALMAARDCLLRHSKEDALFNVMLYEEFHRHDDHSMSFHRNISSLQKYTTIFLQRVAHLFDDARRGSFNSRVALSMTCHQLSSDAFLFPASIMCDSTWCFRSLPYIQYTLRAVSSDEGLNQMLYRFMKDDHAEFWFSDNQISGVDKYSRLLSGVVRKAVSYVNKSRNGIS